MSKIKELYQAARAFFKALHTVSFGWSWKAAGRKKRFGVAFFRMLWITFKGFREDLVTLRAASLTYITLVSIIPTLVFSFAIAKGMGATEKLIGMINDGISDFPEGPREAILGIVEKVQGADYAAIGATGFVVAAFTAIKLLGKIEHSMNDIWGVKQHRTMLRKFSDYISAVVMIPVLILASSAVTVMLSSKMLQAEIHSYLGPAAFVVETLLSFSGLFIIIFAFFLLYIWLPNTNVKIFPAFIGGVVGGISWKLMLLIFVKFQSNLAGAGAVYGTFAALPLFLVWLYTSWVVVLFGSEVAFSAQYWRTYDLNAKEKHLNFASAMTLALVVMKGVVAAFREGNHWCPERFADRRFLSVKNVLAVTDLLVKNGILERNEQPMLHFVPAKMLKNISVGDIVKAVAGEEFEYIKNAESLKTGVVDFNEKKWDDYMVALSSKNIAEL